MQKLLMVVAGAFMGYAGARIHADSKKNKNNSPPIESSPVETIAPPEPVEKVEEINEEPSSELIDSKGVTESNDSED